MLQPDNECYTNDVCNRWFLFPAYLENTLVMESNVDEIPAGTLCGTVTKSSISSLSGGVVTTPTNMDSDVPVNGAAWLNENNFALPSSCVENLK